MNRLVFLLITCLSIPACSNQQVYGTLQSVEIGRCVDGPANHYQACMQQNSMEYAEYAALREADEETQ